MDSPERLFVAADYAAAALGPRTHRTKQASGQITEHEAIVKLLRLGHQVAVPVVDDDGVDMIVNYKHLVQVKSQHTQSQASGTSWIFQYAGPRRREVRADMFIFHAAPIDAWWVIPTAVLLEFGIGTRQTGLSLSTLPQRAYKHRHLSETYRDAWHLFDREV